MRRLVELLSPSHRAKVEDDLGAVAAIVAVVVSSSLVIVSMAFVFDFGRIYVEKRVVQNAADAALASLAQHCSKGEPQCKSLDAGFADATMVANGNSPDGLTRVLMICDSGSRFPFPTCDSTDRDSASSPGPTSTCHAIQPPEKRSYLRLVTSTKTRSIPDTALSPVFASLITGSESATELVGCSQVAMSTVGSIDKLVSPLALGLCSYRSLSTDSAGQGYIQHFPDSNNSSTCDFVDVTGLARPTNSLRGFAFVDSYGKYTGSVPSENVIRCNEQFAKALRVSVGNLTASPDNAVLRRNPALNQICQSYEITSTSTDTAANKERNVAAFLRDKINGGQTLIIPLVGYGAGSAGNWQMIIRSFTGFKVTGFCLSNWQYGNAERNAGGSYKNCSPDSNWRLYGKFVPVVTKGTGFTETYDENVPWTGVATLNNLP